jgi:hypothetical protein
MAGLLNKLKKGGIHYVYIIQNTEMEDVFEMVSHLSPHVKLVGHEQLAHLAWQRQFE